MVLESDISRWPPLFTVLILIALVPQTEAHQMFNEEEEKIGGYRIQVATDPEIPGPDNPSRVLVAITDYDGNDLYDIVVGLKIFKDEVLVKEVLPRVYSIGHFDIGYTFPESGMYILQVDVINPSGKEISAKFNIGIIQAFGYIFYSMVVIGATFPPTLIGIILLMKRKKAKRASA